VSGVVDPAGLAVVDGATDAASGTDDAWLGALAGILRRILAVGLASAVAGVLVAGIGGRVAMRIAALLNPQAAGSVTENGAIVGAITLDGTFALLFFGGLLGGLIASVVFVAIEQWLPGSGAGRALVAGVVAIALGAPFVVDRANPDFLLLREDALIVAMFVAVIGGFGVVMSLLTDVLQRRLPAPGSPPTSSVLLGGLLVLLGGFLFLPIALQIYGQPAACLCTPEGTGVQLLLPLLLAGFATLVAWGQILAGRVAPSRPVAWTGRIGTLAAVLVGTAILAIDVAEIAG
jgi:hypothetical protein